MPFHSLWKVEAGVVNRSEPRKKLMPVENTTLVWLLTMSYSAPSTNSEAVVLFLDNFFADFPKKQRFRPRSFNFGVARKQFTGRMGAPSRERGCASQFAVTRRLTTRDEIPIQCV